MTLSHSGAGVPFRRLLFERRENALAAMEVAMRSLVARGYRFSQHRSTMEPCHFTLVRRVLYRRGAVYVTVRSLLRKYDHGYLVSI